jgi:putative flippase GtrA
MKIVGFGIISGIGWLIDFAIFNALVYLLHWLPGLANLLSASVALTFVFFTATRKTLLVRERGLHFKFMAYLAYQAVSICFYAWLIGFVSGFMPPPLAKILVTPVSFYTSYLFMTWLLTGRVRYF